MGAGATHRRLSSVGVHIRRKDYVGILVTFRSGKNFTQEFDTSVFLSEQDSIGWFNNDSYLLLKYFAGAMDWMR